MVLKDLLKSIKKDLRHDYWFHIINEDDGVHIGIIQLNSIEECITLKNVIDDIIDVLDREVSLFEIYNEFEFIIKIK